MRRIMPTCELDGHQRHYIRVSVSGMTLCNRSLTRTQILLREFLKCQSFLCFLGFITIPKWPMALGTCNLVGRQIANTGLLTNAAWTSGLMRTITKKRSTSHICNEITIPLQKNELISETKFHWTWKLIKIVTIAAVVVPVQCIFDHSGVYYLVCGLSAHIN